MFSRYPGYALRILRRIIREKNRDNDFYFKDHSAKMDKWKIENETKMDSLKKEIQDNYEALSIEMKATASKEIKLEDKAKVNNAKRLKHEELEA